MTARPGWVGSIPPPPSQLLLLGCRDRLTELWRLIGVEQQKALGSYWPSAFVTFNSRKAQVGLTTWQEQPAGPQRRRVANPPPPLAPLAMPRPPRLDQALGRPLRAYSLVSWLSDPPRSQELASLPPALPSRSHPSCYEWPVHESCVATLVSTPQPASPSLYVHTPAPAPARARTRTRTHVPCPTINLSRALL